MENQVTLPEKVKRMVEKICEEQGKPPIDKYAQQLLSVIGEENALGILNTISGRRITKSFGGFINHLVKKEHPAQYAALRSSTYNSPSKRPFSPSSASPFTSPQKISRVSLQSPLLNSQMNSTVSTLHRSDPHNFIRQLSFENDTEQRIGPSAQHQLLNSQMNSAVSTLHRSDPHNIIRQLSFEDDTEQCIGPGAQHQLSFTDELKDKTKSMAISEQMIILSKLEYRKLFLVLSYCGGQKLEDVVTVDGANEILSKEDLAMSDFESDIWNKYGKYMVDKDKNNMVERSQYYDWDSGKTHLYYCDVRADGKYRFKGPYLNGPRTHLQRSLGDDNILIVKFFEGSTYSMDSIVDEGIIVGLRHYRYFVFKDERKKVKKNLTEKERKASSATIKCYFVHTDIAALNINDQNYDFRGKSISNARRLFMHVHMVPTLEKYMARFSLILSKTIKLQIDLGAVQIIEIDDIYFRDGNGSIMHDEEGNALIHTDGTGFISEDLAMKCPKDFTAAMYITDNSFEKNNEFVGSGDLPCQERGAKSRNNEPPLLIQCRLFYHGCAVKGTLLVNKKLEQGTIQVRPSMIKVRKDETLANEETFNSLEIVAVSRRPGRTSLSKNLIALLSYGGVPEKFFLNLLTNALEDTSNVYSNRRAALRVAANHDGLEYGFVAQRMISSGIPLNEPYLQLCLSKLQRDGKGKLKEGKIPIGDCFYLMGTADPTGVLNYDEVSVILENGQISGQVLVYRHPGLHFGDIHVMKAVYVKELEEVVGNSKYGIFFSTKGWRSAPYEMATGDFDGDMYWVSRNPELLKEFTANEPWKRVHMTQDSNSRKLPDSPAELECKLFRLFLEASKPSFNMATACHSWLSYMDRLLTLKDNCASEKDSLKKKMIQLIDIYYDALDAPKSGKRVKVPSRLIADMYPHHMGRDAESSYHSTSILGQIHDIVEKLKDEPGPKQEIWKLPCFDIAIPEGYVNMWKVRYDEYRREMSKALDSKHEFKNAAANEVIKKYKQLLYDAADMEESTKSTEMIYEEALAIYHVTYDYAISQGEIGKCNFAWKVAGSALCNIYAWKLAGPKEIPLVILPSVLRDLLN
ncbi:hypothetical protein ACJIZ3_006889 [Penstemon smallii]|uniref:RNA-dependent RNA polymerase n=1 Tax=Penstemon smallii TaxID=265156 RepID=A0ABD3S8Z9_9LAMI